ncbi:helix-turn-helix domain-containing protein [Streptomyces sp. NPDC057889]|uniref:helix-turn-helix domain-containing protein n=1 Tax=unclassified Streptomyces TaxID=2593676 RepID=UPI003699B1F9
MRRLLAEAGLVISAGKMSALWSGTPVTVRLDDLEVLCRVLGCDAAGLLVCEPGPDVSHGGAQGLPVPASSTGATAFGPGAVAAASGSFDRPSARGVRPAATSGRPRPSLPPV